jgi:hypothetical protein
MAKFWFKVLMLAACLGGVIAAQIYLSDIAGQGSFATSFEDPDRVIPPLEVEAQSTQAVVEGEREKSSQ